MSSQQINIEMKKIYMQELRIYFKSYYNEVLMMQKLQQQDSQIKMQKQMLNRQKLINKLRNTQFDFITQDDKEYIERSKNDVLPSVQKRLDELKKIEYEKMYLSNKLEINEFSRYTMQSEELDTVEAEISNYPKNQKRYLYWLDHYKLDNQKKIALGCNSVRINSIRES